MEKGTCRMGWFVRNRINQFEGFVTGKVYWLYGCEKIILIPKKSEDNLLGSVISSQERIMVSEEFLELLTDEDNKTYEKEFELPDIDKYFGMMCRDRVTGYEGVAIGCITSLYGTDMYALEPLASKNKKKLKDHKWFDVGRLELISRRVSTDEVQDKKPGGVEDWMPSRELIMALS